MARILVVDDEDLPRQAVARLLEKAGHEVREANGGTAALAVWREGAADLVLTDLAMPDMNGFELVARLRETGETVPVLAVSGNVVVTDGEVLRHAELLARVHLLAKPFSREQLLSAIASALDRPAA